MCWCPEGVTKPVKEKRVLDKEKRAVDLDLA
jgi:hypothetical protein